MEVANPFVNANKVILTKQKISDFTYEFSIFGVIILKNETKNKILIYVLNLARFLVGVTY